MTDFSSSNNVFLRWLPEVPLKNKVIERIILRRINTMFYLWVILVILLIELINAYFICDLRKNIAINGVSIKEKCLLGLRKTCRNVAIYDVVISGVECMAEIGYLPGPKIYIGCRENRYTRSRYNRTTLYIEVAIGSYVASNKMLFASTFFHVKHRKREPGVYTDS